MDSLHYLERTSMQHNGLVPVLGSRQPPKPPKCPEYWTTSQNQGSMGHDFRYSGGPGSICLGLWLRLCRSDWGVGGLGRSKQRVSDPQPQLPVSEAFAWTPKAFKTMAPSL